MASQALREAPLASRAGLCLGLGLVFAFGCRSPEAPPCPSINWCTTVDRALAMKQTPEVMLLCPIYVAWGKEKGPPPDPAVPPDGEASIDREATRHRRATGASDVCCYRWYQTCPAKPPPPP
jgi:hypothetical protein